MLQGHAIVQTLSLWHLGKMPVGLVVKIMTLEWVSLMYFDFPQAVFKQCFIFVFIFMAILSDEQANF